MYSVGFASWAAVLFFQNVAFTFTSRARNSASLGRHLQASVFSNGIWIFSNMLMLGPMFAYLTGKHGLLPQVLTGTLYTVSTVSGSLVAHYLSKKTECGKNAVGASDRYVQITKEDWEQMQKDLIAVTKIATAAVVVIEKLPTKDEMQQVRDIAGQAYDICVGIIPDAHIRATKIAGEIIKTGIPQ